MSTNPDTSFDAIVAAFGNQLRCEATTHTGGRCLRLVRWRLNLHGCEQVLLCSQHLRAWEREADAECRPECAHCGGRFDSLAAAYTVTAA
ncbi:hypothetical protein PR370_01945 [Mycobacterium marinum]|uniref:hypothetical protein n=1 Tax=Mycobacterium marinum TaxID=1781 RepID=UPI002358AA96|nr:hypothetical protein [Mycobacterium marinum]MDC8980498.1 hypothetical protein [Mycobacterium marinum]MDC8998068.1 hypothetical protein [Mycobacterium marinum]MDC9008808.1 hypothetical protein [Mycobacterium marinum]